MLWWVFLRRGYEFVALHTAKVDARRHYKLALRALAVVMTFFSGRAVAVRAFAAPEETSADLGWIVVYDALATPWWQSNVIKSSMVPLVVGAVMLIGRKHVMAWIDAGLLAVVKDRVFYNLVAGLFLVVGAAVGPTFAYHAYQAEERVRRAYETGEVVSVDGAISNVDVSDRDDPIPISFIISGTRIHTSSFRNTFDFHASKRARVSLRDGDYVRLEYFDLKGVPRVVRLEKRLEVR
jgi:hypothetical protein